MGVDAPERRLGLGRELADDLLEDVFERHQPLQVAILVHDEGDAAPEAPEAQQLLVERRALGREERLASRGDLAQALARQASRGKLVRDEAHVHDAVHAVEVPVEERHARVGRLAQASADLVPFRRDVDAVDLAARNHHVLDAAPLEAKQRLDHALALGGLGDERVGEIGDRVAVGLRDLRGAVPARHREEAGRHEPGDEAGGQAPCRAVTAEPAEAAQQEQERKTGDREHRNPELRIGRRQRNAGDERAQHERAQQHRGEARAPRLIRHAAGESRDPGFLE